MVKRKRARKVKKNISSKKQGNSEYTKANRKHKDCLFRKVFEKKEDLLQLYNALNGTDYQNADDLEVNTLEDVVYLGIKNDKSFLLGETMNLYEHQSTYNPNIPIRGVLYFARLYQQYIDTKGIRVYGTKVIKLPLPQYIVFYNGTKLEPEKSFLRLSDAFGGENVEPALECVATMLNINYGNNKDLMNKCKKLEEYSIFVATVRKYTQESGSLSRAVDLAVDECIENGILRELLTKCRSEVTNMLLTSFDQEEYEATIHDEAYEEGWEDGEKSGKALGEQIGKRQLLLELIQENLSDGRTLEEIAAFLKKDIKEIQRLIED